MWNIKYNIDELIYEVEIDLQTQRTDLWLTRGEGWGVGMGIWDQQMQTNIYTEYINNKILLYSTGNYIQYPEINHNGREYEKECMYI